MDECEHNCVFDVPFSFIQIKVSGKMTVCTEQLASTFSIIRARLGEDITFSTFLLLKCFTNRTNPTLSLHQYITAHRCALKHERPHPFIKQMTNRKKASATVFLAIVCACGDLLQHNVFVRSHGNRWFCMYRLCVIYFHILCIIVEIM